MGGKVLTTSVSHEDEAKLQAALRSAKARFAAGKVAPKFYGNASYVC
jgi:uncharacterized membrane protein